MGLNMPRKDATLEVYQANLPAHKKAPIVSGGEIDRGIESTECSVSLGEEDEQSLMSKVY